MYKPIMPKDSTPQVVMKQFPLYFKNMYATLKKLYSGESDEDLKLRASAANAMFQEMLITGRQYCNVATTTETQSRSSSACYRTC